MSDADALVYTVFADGPGGGNPCPVVPHADHLSSEDMTSLAARWGFETGFLMTPTTPEADIRLRYFVPKHEMEMCVHATVAALTYAAEHALLAPGAVKVETVLGVLDAEIATDGRVVVEQFPPSFGPVLTDERPSLAAALGCAAERIITGHDAPRAVTVSRPKLMVELDSVDAVHQLRPDAELIQALCAELDVTGLYPYAALHARQFPKNSGYVEDAATGLAAAALAAHLAAREPGDGDFSYDIHQGEAMGRPSRIRTHCTRRDGEITRVAVSGYAQRASAFGSALR